MSGAQRWKSCGLSTYPVLLPTCPSPICFLECSPRLIKTDTAEVKHGGKREREKQKDERSDSAFGAPVQPTLEMSSQGKSKTGPTNSKRGKKWIWRALPRAQTNPRSWQRRLQVRRCSTQTRQAPDTEKSVAAKSKSRLQPPRTHAHKKQPVSLGRGFRTEFSNILMEFAPIANEGKTFAAGI